MLEQSLLGTLQRGIRRGVMNLRRERGWITSLGALLGVFLLLQLLMFMLVGIEGARELLKSRTDLRLELHDTTNQEKQEFYSALQALPYIEDTVYITREEAYERTRKNDPELIAFIEEFKLKNPFADTIGVTLRSLNDYDQFKTFVEQERWKNVLEPSFLSEITTQEKYVHELLRVTGAVRHTAFAILILTIIAVILVTVELTSHRALLRSDEVLVERLAGAAPLGIVLPFAVEATVLFWGAIALSTVLLTIIGSLLPTLVPALDAGGVLAPLREETVPLLWTNLPLLIMGEILLAPVVALIGAWIGVRRQITASTVTFG